MLHRRVSQGPASGRPRLSELGGSASETFQTEEADRQLRGTVQAQLGGDAPEGGRELEAMPRQTGDDQRAWPPRESIDDEVLVGRPGVHTCASCEQGAPQAWDMMGAE